MSAVGLLWRLGLTLVVLAVAPPLACTGVHRLTHPAPLGRSREAMLRHLDAALPPGTTIDSAARYLRRLGLTVDRYSTAEASRAVFGRSDTLWAHGPVLEGVQPAIDRGWDVWNGYFVLYFTPHGTLAHRDAHLVAVSPL